MRVEFSCAECGAVLEADAELGGGVQPCPNCNALLLVPAPSIRPGTTIADFYIERKLGSGAMGDVYLATQLSLQREVALKILPPAFVRDPQHLQRFLHEVQLAARLEHPNIVTVYAAGEDNGVYYMAMAYVRGESLQEHLDKAGPLPERRAFEIARKIADALNYAWEKFRLVHRDIKPANIMVDENGEPRLLDMGLAKCTAVDVGLTAVGLVVGTPAFMSPEQADPKKEVDFRADMYSLGATLYTLVTGRRPFSGKEARAVLREVAKGIRTAPIELNPRLSKTGSDIIMRMMARRREDRYQTWQDLIRAIDAFLAGDAATAAAPASGHSANSPPPAVPAQSPGRVVPPPPAASRARTKKTSHAVRRRIPVFLGLLVLAGAVGFGIRQWREGRLRVPVHLRLRRAGTSPGKPAAGKDNDSGRNVSGTTAPDTGVTTGAGDESVPSPPSGTASGKQQFLPATVQELEAIHARAQRRLAEEFDEQAAARQAARDLGIGWPPPEPVLTPDELDKAVNTLVRRRVDAAVPRPNLAAVEKEARKKFPLCRIGDRVTLRVKVAYGLKDRFDGVFMGVKNGKVIIGPKHIPLINIRDEDRWQIDPVENERQRKAWVKKRIEEVEAERRKKAEEVMPEVRRQAAQNAGYVLLDGKWMTPREAVDSRVRKQRQRLFKVLFEEECRKAGLVNKEGRWGRMTALPASGEPSPKQKQN